ncbi:MAG: hypothetical protein BWY84_00389 [Candidatus Aerophobetes bacterium ADurb.Bin490]|nr:MAG: hypothetical protein BWY84_00389 [Candidatus Aerophobetes bacterium ADurb.Bin490]
MLFISGVMFEGALTLSFKVSNFSVMNSPSEALNSFTACFKPSDDSFNLGVRGISILTVSFAAKTGPCGFFAFTAGGFSGAGSALPAATAAGANASPCFTAASDAAAAETFAASTDSGTEDEICFAAISTTAVFTAAIKDSFSAGVKANFSAAAITTGFAAITASGCAASFVISPVILRAAAAV